MWKTVCNKASYSRGLLKRECSIFGFTKHSWCFIFRYVTVSIYSFWCLESQNLFYKDLLLTDLLKELDEVSTLPTSVYFMLFQISLFAEDEISSVRATDILLSLWSSHSQYPRNFISFLPSSDMLCSMWSTFGIL